MSNPSTLLYAALKPLLFRLDAERAHDVVSMLLRLAGRSPLALAAVRALHSYEHPALAVELAGLRFANPLGVAAGFDKRAALTRPLAALGFGHVEVGTVTPRPQPGNPRPRMFRLPSDGALINRLGFNSPGMLPVAHNLRSRTHPSSVVVGVNIGKNRATTLERASEDYVAAFVALAPLAAYVTVNISSPNTPGLRQLHERAALHELLGMLVEVNQRLVQPRPLFVKVSPDETPAQLDVVVEVARAAGITGFVATNTTLDRAGLHGPQRGAAGGLSGRPLAERARAVIGHLHAATAGQLPVIGVGGVVCAADAYSHMAAGATLVQLYTGMVYAGPAVAYTIKRELVTLLRQNGHATVNDVVGSSLK